MSYFTKKSASEIDQSFCRLSHHLLRMQQSDEECEEFYKYSCIWPAAVICPSWPILEIRSRFTSRLDFNSYRFTNLLLSSSLKVFTPISNYGNCCWKVPFLCQCFTFTWSASLLRDYFPFEMLISHEMWVVETSFFKIIQPIMISSFTYKVSICFGQIRLFQTFSLSCLVVAATNREPVSTSHACWR